MDDIVFLDKMQPFIHYEFKGIMLKIKRNEVNMAPRGGAREGAGRPFKDPKDKRQVLHCRVKGKTLDWLDQERDRTSHSTGKLVDRAVEVLKATPKKERYPKN